MIATPDSRARAGGRRAQLPPDIYVGRKFNMEDVAKGGVPRLGAAVPRWYGETIGFWDKDVLITWTATSRAGSRTRSSSSRTRCSRSRSTRRSARRRQVHRLEPRGDPLRRRRARRADTHRAQLPQDERLQDADRRRTRSSSACQTIFSVNGKNTPLTPGAKIEYEMPDMYGRPWAQDLGAVLRAGHEEARRERGPVQLRQEIATTARCHVSTRRRVGTSAKFRGVP